MHLERDRAAGVLALLTDRLRNDVMLRIATFGGVQPAALSELTDVLNSVLAGQGAKRSKMGGVRTAAEILNMMNSTEEETVVASLRERDADLAQKIIDEMFVFDNLLDVEDRAIQLILKKSTTTRSWSRSRAPRKLRAKFLRNMSSRAAEMLREDLEAQGPIRMSKVEAEQKKILQIARRLAESGQIVLGNSGTTRMSDADTGSTTQLSRSAAWRLADAVVRRAAARRGRARAGTRSRPGPRGRAGAAARPGRGRGPRGRLRAGHAAGHDAGAPKGAKPVLPKAARPATPRALPWPANRAPTRPPACTPWPNPAPHRSARWKSAWARAC